MGVASSAPWDVLRRNLPRADHERQSRPRTCTYIWVSCSRRANSSAMARGTTGENAFPFTHIFNQRIKKQLIESARALQLGLLEQLLAQLQSLITTSSEAVVADVPSCIAMCHP